MAALDWITIEGFKSIKRIERLPLNPINVLIGSNGSGKSNFIDLFSFLREIRAGRLQEYVRRSGGADKVLHFGSRNTSTLDIHASLGDEVNQYVLTLASNAEDSLFPLREVCRGRGQRRILSTSGPETWISERDPHSRDRDAAIQDVRKHLDGWRVLSHRHGDSYDLIRRTVRLVAPFFDDFQLQPQALNQDKIRLEWRHRGSDAYFDTSSLSDGTLRFIVLATLLIQPESLRPSVILLDEPELGLHPYAVTLLASLFKQASVETQVVFATQSTLLLDHFRPEDVLVADRVDGGTQLTRLDAAELEEWLQDYSLGQLWEKNQFGGRPGRSGAERK